MPTTYTVNNGVSTFNISVEGGFTRPMNDTSDLPDSTDRRYVTDADLVNLGNLSGTNTGDQDLSGLVPKTTTVNGYQLSSNITLSKSDVGLDNVDNTSDLNKPISTATQTALNGKVDTVVGYGLSENNFSDADKTKLDGLVSGVNDHSALSNIGTNSHAQIDTHIGSTSNPHSVTKTQIGLENVPNVDATVASNITQDSTHRFVTDSEKSTWNGKQDALGYTPENVANKQTDLTASSTKYPTVDAVNTGLSGKVDKIVGKGLSTEDYTTSEKSKLAGIESGAQVNTVTSVASKTGAVTLVKADVGLGNVDNTSDVDKPVSTAQATADSAVLSSANSYSDGKVADSISDGVTTVAPSQNAVFDALTLKADSSHTHVISDVTGLQNALDNKVDENAAITGATKTKITYDSKGLVTSGTDATTADIADSSNKRYVTDAQLTVIGNTSGTNTGDQTSIAGITGTKAQFDTACTDGDFAYQSDLSSYLLSSTASSTYQPLDTQLTDLAGLSYTGNTLKVVRVNAAETGFELATITSGSGNSVNVSVDFGGSFTDKAQTIVTGQTWVTATSKIIPQILTPSGSDPDEMYLLDMKVVISDLVNGDGFTVTLYSQPEAKGTYNVMCIGQ